MENKGSTQIETSAIQSNDCWGSLRSLPVFAVVLVNRREKYFGVLACVLVGMHDKTPSEMCHAGGLWCHLVVKVSHNRLLSEILDHAWWMRDIAR